MDAFPAFPSVDGTLPSQLALYTKLRDSCRFAVTLLGEEEIDVIRLKTLGDGLAHAIDDLPLFHETDLPLAWVTDIHKFAQGVLESVRSTQHAVLDECVWKSLCEGLRLTS